MIDLKFNSTGHYRTVAYRTAVGGFVCIERMVVWGVPYYA